MMLPLEVTMVPLFLIIKTLDWPNTYQGLSCPVLVDGFGVFLMRQYLQEHSERADRGGAIDGASELRIFFQIVMPLCKPALAALGVFTFREAWDMYIWPLIIVTKDSLRTLPLGISLFMSSFGTAWDQLMAVAAIGTLPMILLFFFLQRSFIQGIAIERSEGVAGDARRRCGARRYARYGGRSRWPTARFPVRVLARSLVRVRPAAFAAPTCTSCPAECRSASCRVSSATNLGDVVELGAGVTQWKRRSRHRGDRRHVRALPPLPGGTHTALPHDDADRIERDGGHAEYVAVPTANLVALDDGIAYEAAAILPDAVACMYHSLIHQGGVGIGQRVLILGVGGLGIHGVQIAKSAGAEVLATSRRPQRLALAAQYGAVAINTAEEPLEVAVARLTDGEGVDVVVDNIGNRASVREGLAVLRPGGRFLVVAYLDETFEVPSMRLFKTEQQIIGCRGSTKQDLIDVVRLVRTGQLTPVLGASYALEQIDNAVARLESGDVVGRIWLTRD